MSMDFTFIYLPYKDHKSLKRFELDRSPLNRNVKYE